MNTIKGLALAAGAAVLVLAAAVAAGTASWRAPVYGLERDLPPAVPIDAQVAAARLGEAIRFQTVSHQDPAQNDWRQWDGLQAWLEATYPAAHQAIRREVVAGHTLVYAWPGSDPTLPPILLMAHQDVVPADEASGGRWARPAFSGALVDGAVWGRGALDDKGALVGIMEAVESLARRGFRPRRGVLLVFGHDEEAGGTGAAAAARLLRERGIRPEFALDEGGLALTADPLTGRPVALIAVAEKGYATLRVTAHGAGGHSSQPPRQTATLVLARAVDRIASRPFPLRFDGPGADTARALAAGAPPGPRVLIANSWLFGPLLAAKLGESRAGAALLHTTIAPTVLQGSPKENVLPETVTALINYRLHPRDSRATALARARAAVRGLPVELEWEPVGAEASPVSATTSRGWRLVAALARQETGARPVPGLSPGATDGRSMSGVARDVYRFLPVLITSEDLETMHGVNERLSVENLHRMCQFYQRLIVAAAG